MLVFYDPSSLLIELEISKIKHTRKKGQVKVINPIMASIFFRKCGGLNTDLYEHCN